MGNKFKELYISKFRTPKDPGFLGKRTELWIGTKLLNPFINPFSDKSLALYHNSANWMLPLLSPCNLKDMKILRQIVLIKEKCIILCDKYN